MEVIINKLNSLPETIIYVFLGLCAFAENICPPIPGDIIVAFGAFLVGANKLSFAIVYFSTTFGSLAGFMSVFLFGTYLGKKFFMVRKFPFFKKEDIIKAEERLKSYGYILIFFNRK